MDDSSPRIRNFGGANGVQKLVIDHEFDKVIGYPFGVECRMNAYELPVKVEASKANAASTSPAATPRDADLVEFLVEAVTHPIKYNL